MASLIESGGINRGKEVESSPSVIIPEDLPGRIRLAENHLGGVEARQMADWIASASNGDCFWDSRFLGGCPEVVEEVLQSCGLTNQSEEVSAHVNGNYWTHYLTPLAARGDRNLIWESAKRVIQLDPGIEVPKIERLLPPIYSYPFWYSLGGDRLQDFVLGFSDENELRADVLGLRALGHLRENPNLSLSQLTAIAQNELPLVEGDGYQNHFCSKIAERHINPVYGHWVLRTIAQTAPSLCGTGVVPIQSPELIQTG